MDHNIEKEMKALLYHFWITKEEDQQLYYQIKYNQNALKDFVAKNLGSNLIIHDRFIKLEKVPTVIKENNKPENFTNPLDYVILMIVLMFLEDKTRGDKFILSDLIEYIKNTAITLELDHIPDWNKVADRRSLINVIKFLKSIYAIEAKDEEKISFADNKEAEALYETKGLSNYVMRIFDNDILALKTPEEFIKSEFGSQDDQKGDIRRYRVFRNILYTPATFSKDLLPTDVDYLKKNRFYIQNEIHKKINMEVEITHNMTMLFEDINSLEKDNFPNTKKITEIVLMVNAKILEKILQGELELDPFETVTVPTIYLEKIIKDIKKEKKPYIGKTYEIYPDEKFCREVLDYMSKYNLIEKNGEDTILYPTIGRLIGKTMAVKKEQFEEIRLFGGMYEL